MRQASSGYDIIQAFPIGGTSYTIAASASNVVTALSSNKLEVCTVLNSSGHLAYVRFGKDISVDADATTPHTETIILGNGERFTGAIPYGSTHVSVKLGSGSGSVYFTEGARYFE
jgi:malate/lactate dehydrogenase